MQIIKYKKGSIYSLGKYNWQILDIQNGEALLLSKNILEKRAYHESPGNITWEKSTLRKYLNDEFYNKTFSTEEKKMIYETKIVNDNNPWYDTEGGSDTTDKIFLLSIEEVAEYLGVSEEFGERKGKYEENYEAVLHGEACYISDEYNDARIAKTKEGEAWWWWLRSSGNYSDLAASVNHVGDLYLLGNLVHTVSIGVRPALWIDLEY